MGFDTCTSGNGTESRRRNWGEWSEAEVDEVFQTLADARCRHLLGYLATAENRTIPLEEVADHVAQSTGEPKEAIEVALYHHHLPRCDAVGLLEHDETTDEVTYCEDPMVEALFQAAAAATGSGY